MSSGVLEAWAWSSGPLFWTALSSGMQKFFHLYPYPQHERSIPRWRAVYAAGLFAHPVNQVQSIGSNSDFFFFVFFNFKIFNSYMRSQTLTQIFKNTSESNTVTPHGGTKANTCKTSVITRLSFPKTPADVVNNLPSLTYLGFPGGSAVKNTPAMQETWVSSLGWEDPLE